MCSDTVLNLLKRVTDGSFLFICKKLLFLLLPFLNLGAQIKHHQNRYTDLKQVLELPVRECRSRQLLTAIINFLSPLKMLIKKKPYLKFSILKAYLKGFLKINFPLFVVLISQKIYQCFRSELTWHEEKREGYHLPFGLTLKDNFSIFPSLLGALSPQHLLNFVSGYSKMHLSFKYLLCTPRPVSPSDSYYHSP